MGSITQQSKQAKAFFDLYQAMSEKVQKEVRKMILSENNDFTSKDASDYSGWSEDSLKEIWDTSENDHWDDFFKTHGYV